jgi:two-component sensor histidine kinase
MKPADTGTMEGERALRHALKNQLAVIAAVARALAREARGADELSRRLEDKLIALAAAHDIVQPGGARGIVAHEALSSLLQASDAGRSVAIADIPPARLSAQAVQQVALILDELVTDAVAAGALGGVGGGVRLSGRCSDAALTLRWDAATADRGGLYLVRRMGGVGRRAPRIEAHERGLTVEFHVRTLPGSSD